MTTTRTLNDSVAKVRAATIRMREMREMRDAANAAEVASIVGRLSAAQKRGILEARLGDGTFALHGATARALEQRGLVRDLTPTGVGSQVWVTLTETGGKVYRALRHEQRVIRKAEMEAERAANR